MRAWRETEPVPARALARRVVMLLAAVSVASAPACNAIPINLPDPTSAPDSGTLPPRDALGGVDSGAHDGPYYVEDATNGPDMNVVPSFDGALDGGTAGEGLVEDGLPPPLEGGADGPDGGLPDALSVEGGAPDALPPSSEGGAPDALPGEAGAADGLLAADGTPDS
jgi:hypothetical protein